MKCEHAVRVRDELVSNCLAKRVFDMIFGGLCECEWVCVDVFSVIYFCPRRKTIHRDNNDPKGMKILWHLFRCCGHIVANTNNPNQIDRLIKWDKTTATATATRYNIHCTVANIGWGIVKLLSLTCADRVFPFKSFFCSSARLMNLKFIANTQIYTTKQIGKNGSLESRTHLIWNLASITNNFLLFALIKCYNMYSDTKLSNRPQSVTAYFRRWFWSIAFVPHWYRSALIRVDQYGSISHPASVFPKRTRTCGL